MVDNAAQVQALVTRDGDRCHYCKRILTPTEMTRDHRIPKTRGGSNYLPNLVISCAPCNNIKGDLTDKEFLDVDFWLREKWRKEWLRNVEEKRIKREQAIMSARPQHNYW